MRDRATWEPVARAAASASGFDPDVFAAVIDRESGYDPALVSPAGAVGIAQIVPQWHPGVDPRDPAASLWYAARLLAGHQARFGSVELALAAYNAGPTVVADLGRVPDYPETQAYVRGIMEAAAASRGAVASPQPDGADASVPGRVATGLAVLNAPWSIDRRSLAVLAGLVAAVLIVAVAE